MERKGYAIEVHQGREDEPGFWASIPALAGCFTQGDTYEETVANADEEAMC